MARIDRIIARRTFAARKINRRQKLHRVFDAPRGTPFRKLHRKPDARLPYHATGSPWWQTRFADLVERRKAGGVRHA